MKKYINQISILPKITKNGLSITQMSENSSNLVDSLKPLENIRNLTKNNPKLPQLELNQQRVYELNKYKLSLYINREIQNEITLGGELISNKLNNQILDHNFSFSEESTNNLYLHKKISDYFVLIHFKYLKPNKDRKKIVEFNNYCLESSEKHFGMELGIFQKLTGADDNPAYKEAKHEDLMEEGFQFVEDHYNDPTPFYFNINIMNKKSETLQYQCHSEENQISVDKVRFFYPESTLKFLFLKNLKPSEDDWDKRIKEIKGVNKFDKITDKISEEDAQFGDGYTPEFYTLNKKLQEEMINFLEKIEVTADVNSFVRYLGLNRERREYLGWLYKIVNFLNEK